MRSQSYSLDYAAVTLSSLCLIHCLFLPILAVSLPVMGVLSEMEWVHRLFVILAVPLSLLACLSPISHGLRGVLRLAALVGVICLVVGAFVEALHDYEVILTAIGSVLLAGAHIGRILFRSHDHGQDPQIEG